MYFKEEKLWQTDLSQEKELHLMEKCGGVFMICREVVGQHTLVTENTKQKEIVSILSTSIISYGFEGGRKNEISFNISFQILKARRRK